MRTGDIQRDLQRQLARELCAILDGWKRIEIVDRFGIRPERVSELRHGNLARFSIGRLVHLIAETGYDIEIAIRPTQPVKLARRPLTATVVRYDRFGRIMPTPKH
jgi:predicted XRE-type DNA-binding protein